MSIDASLVLLHYNQSNCLRKTILALEQQKTDKTFEVIIADDGSNFKNLLEIENIIKTSSLPIQLVWQQDLGFRAAKARNNGIMLSRSDLVILTDGDNIPNSDFIEKHILAHKNSDNTICTGSRIWKNEAELNEQNVNIEQIERNKFLETQENIQRNKSFHSINPWQAVYAFSLSFKKGQDTLFDEQFQGFGLEDWEFAYRLSKIHGYSITFDPSIKTTQYDDFKCTKNPFKNLNQNDVNLYIKNALYFIEKYPEDKCLHKDLIKFVSKFAYSQKNQKFEKIYVDFDKLAKKDVNDIIKNYALLTKYKSRLK